MLQALVLSFTASVLGTKCMKDLRHNLTQTCLLVAALLAMPATVQAQFSYITNNGTITITGYTGPAGAVTIPATINGRACEKATRGRLLPCGSHTVREAAFLW